MDDLILALLLSLGLTELFECGFALLCRKRDRALLLCVLVNVITNPPLVLLHRWLGDGWLLIAGLEVSAFLAEGLLYRYSGLYKKPFLFSLAANALSFFLGLLVNQLI